MNIRSNELLVKWPFFKNKLSIDWLFGQITHTKSFRLNDLSIKWLFGQMTFRSNGLTLSNMTCFVESSFGQTTFFWTIEYHRALYWKIGTLAGLGSREAIGAGDHEHGTHNNPCAKTFQMSSHLFNLNHSSSIYACKKSVKRRTANWLFGQMAFGSFY
jgi:hypothetical protein